MAKRQEQTYSTKRLLKKIITAPFVFLAAVIILLEDWLWDDLARIAAAIGRLPIFRQIESLIIGLPPYAALILFGAPSLLLIPVKLIALYFISHGHSLMGLLSLILAKVAGTALVARLFILTRPRLLQINWFARLYEWFVAFKARIYGAIKATAVYQYAHRQSLRIRAFLKVWIGKRKSFWRKRWDAVMKVSRRRKPAQE